MHHGDTNDAQFASTVIDLLKWASRCVVLSLRVRWILLDATQAYYLTPGIGHTQSVMHLLLVYPIEYTYLVDIYGLSRPRGSFKQA